VIHAFGLEPAIVATWGRRDEFRFIHDKFGIGTPRALLELPQFSTWKRSVYDAANRLALTDAEMKRIEELFRLFGEHKCRRADALYDGTRPWLENAEHEYNRRSFAAIVATDNPRGHQAVLLSDQLLMTNGRWACSRGETPARTPEAVATALSAMLVNCTALHLVDPHFGPDNARHRRILEALLDVLSANGVVPAVIRVHCSEKADRTFFEQEAARMATHLPNGISVTFARWKQRDGGERLHNRYVLTDLGGVAVLGGLDAGVAGETDDLLLLPRTQYEQRWAQYVVNDGAFQHVDAPATVHGTRRR
jgi:hypothetical protein